jgi:hypothetical protein
MSFVKILMISILSSSFGTPKLISRSKRPALLKPESIVSGLEVQPITTTCLSDYNEISSIEDAI